MINITSVSNLSSLGLLLRVCFDDVIQQLINNRDKERKHFHGVSGLMRLPCLLVETDDILFEKLVVDAREPRLGHWKRLGQGNALLFADDAVLRLFSVVAVKSCLNLLGDPKVLVKQLDLLEVFVRAGMKSPTSLMSDSGLRLRCHKTSPVGLRTWKLRKRRRVSPVTISVAKAVD